MQNAVAAQRAERSVAIRAGIANGCSSVAWTKLSIPSRERVVDLGVAGRFSTKRGGGAGGSDGLAKLWTTKTKQQFGAAFPGNPGQFGSVRYTPDGSKLIVVYQDGKAFVWPVSLRAWADHACAVAGRNLTREEWSRFVGGHRYVNVCPGLP